MYRGNFLLGLQGVFYSSFRVQILGFADLYNYLLCPTHPALLLKRSALEQVCRNPFPTVQSVQRKDAEAVLDLLGTGLLATLLIWYGAGIKARIPNQQTPENATIPILSCGYAGTSAGISVDVTEK